MIATHVDPWVAKSNIIRMTKSLIYDGYVAGFWNGLCGEVDKSKPPVAGLALSHYIRARRVNHKGVAASDETWVAALLLDQLVMWNSWWNATRAHRGALAPGSTRAMLSSPIACINQDPVSASRCETGLDNSPLYDGATFVPSENCIDSVDVGMTALYARDALELANLSLALGETECVLDRSVGPRVACPNSVHLSSATTLTAGRGLFVH